jgi:hypothetical protein
MVKRKNGEKNQDKKARKKEFFVVVFFHRYTFWRILVSAANARFSIFLRNNLLSEFEEKKISNHIGLD